MIRVSWESYDLYEEQERFRNKQEVRHQTETKPIICSTLDIYFSKELDKFNKQIAWFQREIDLTKNLTGLNSQIFANNRRM